MVDPEIKTDKAQESSAETPSTANSPQAQEAGHKLLSLATLKELATRAKNFGKDFRDNPHGHEILSLEAKNLALAGLAVAEVIPGVEATNDITKALAMAQQVAKKGKSTGFFAALYKDVPKGLKEVFTGLDIAGVPLVGVVPELWQSVANQIHMYKEGFHFARDVVKSGWRNFVKPLPPTPIHA